MKATNNLPLDVKCLVDVCDDTLVTVFAISNNINAMLVTNSDSITDESFTLIHELIEYIKDQYKILVGYPSINNVLDYMKLFNKLINVYSNATHEFYEYVSNSEYNSTEDEYGLMREHIDFDDDDD